MSMKNRRGNREAKKAQDLNKPKVVSSVSPFSTPPPPKAKGAKPK